MSSATLVLNIAYAGLVGATFTRRILVLRSGLVAAGLLFVLYGVMTSNWTMIFWNSVTSILHGAQAVRYIRGQRAVELSDEDARIRATWFPDVEPFAFQSLWTMGETVQYEGGELAIEGQPQSTMMLVLEGSASVDVDGSEVGILQEGDLIGEMSFLSGSAATATVRPVGSVRVREWDQNRLRTLDQLNPAAAAAVRRRIQDNLAHKLLKRSN